MKRDRPMTGSDVREARGRLGEMWGLARPLYASEMGRALRLKGRDVGNTVIDWERKDLEITGPASVAIDMMLDGAPPPDGIAAVIGQQ